MLFVELRDHRWTSPRVLSFSGEYSDGDPAFTPDGKRLFFTSLRPETRYEGERRASFIQEIKARTGALPGVTSAAVGLYFPMMGANWSSTFTGFFETFGIPLRARSLP